jgi:hypothetical protein
MSATATAMSPVPAVAAGARVAGSFLHVGFDDDADGFLPRHDVTDGTLSAAAWAAFFVVVGVEFVTFAFDRGEFVADWFIAALDFVDVFQFFAERDSVRLVGVSSVCRCSSLRMIAAIPALRTFSSAAAATATTPTPLAILPLFADGFALAVDACAESRGRRVFVVKFEIVVQPRLFATIQIVAWMPVVPVAIPVVTTLDSFSLTSLTLTAVVLTARSAPSIVPITPAATTATASAAPTAPRAVVAISPTVATAIVSATVARFRGWRFFFGKRLFDVLVFTPAAAHILRIPRLAFCEIIVIASFRLLRFGRARLCRPAEQLRNRIFFLDRLLGLGRNFNAQIVGERHPIRWSFLRFWSNRRRIRCRCTRRCGGWRRWRRSGVRIDAQLRGQ